VVTCLVIGLDQRYEWSDVPAGVMIAADPCVLLGYGVIFSVFRANPYASRIIEVEPDQQVVSTGTDAVVRHPTYSGGLLIHIAAPLTLGSCWVLWRAALIVPITIANQDRRTPAGEGTSRLSGLSGAPGTGWCQGLVVREASSTTDLSIHADAPIALVAYKASMRLSSGAG